MTTTRTVTNALFGELRAVVQAYADHRGLADTTVAKRFLGSDRFFSRFDSGDAKGLNTSTYDDAMARFSAEWPEDLAWPRGVVRPRVTAQAS